MFDAVIAKKARMDKILEDTKRNPREDLVTSSMVGVLRLLQPEARQIALSILCDHLLPSDARIYLWPFFCNEHESSEPDVVLEFLEDGLRAYWIIEVKWGAALGSDQCAREIRTVVSGQCRRGGVPPGKRRVRGYTLLGAEHHHQEAIAELRRAVRSGLENVPVDRIRSLEWCAVTEKLRALEHQTDDQGLRSWAHLSANFLAGQPQGAVLGPWPKMTMLSRGGFAFDVEERFPLPLMVEVPATQYSFGEFT
jgi:hypothetical protein